MSQVDSELAAAIAATEAVPAPPTSTALGAEPPRRNVGLLVVLLVMGTTLLTLVVVSFGSLAVYSKGVDELIGERERLAGRNVRVEGTLVKGSLQRRAEPCEYRFAIERNGQKLPVHYPHCTVPDTFRDVPYTDVVVTAEGRLDRDTGEFAATQIMAKCPSKYEEHATMPAASIIAPR